MKTLWTGEYIIENYPIQEFQLFHLLRAGVKAFTFTGQEVVDRDSLPKKRANSLESYEQRARLAIGTEETGKIIGGGYNRRKLSADEIMQDFRRQYYSQSEKIVNDPEGCKSISFKLSNDVMERFTAILEAKTFRYESEGVKEYMETHGIMPLEPSLPPTPPEQPEKPIDNTVPTNTDDFIRNLKVEYSSDTSVILMPKGKQSKEYSCQQMGFKATSQTWRMFIDILQKDDPKYYIGIYSKDKNPEKIKKYNSSIKMLENFSKKLVDFLNIAYSAQIPGKSSVFKNMKGIDRDGTYRPIFQVARPATESEDNVNGMSRKQWEKGINILVEKKRREKDYNQELQLLKQMGPYIELGYKNGWLTRNLAKKYLEQNDKDCSPEDALEHAGPLTDSM